MAPTKPVLVIVGGINGCGKSTLAAAAGAEVLLGQSAINPDVLTQEASRQHPTLKGDGANLIGVERAEKSAWRAVAEGVDVAIETVLSSQKFLPLVRAARYRRYRTRLIYIGLPTVELAIERVAQRVESGGHDVPEAKIRERWDRTHDNLRLFLPEVDDVLVFSNARVKPALVAERIGVSSEVRLYLPDELPAIMRRLSRSV